MIHKHGRAVTCRRVVTASEFKPDTMHKDSFYAAADKCLNCTKAKCTGNCKEVGK
jgi:hypothetical protein